MALEQMGFEIEASHHEVAQGQHEIDFKYADALRTADNIMTFKLAVKTLAQKNGLHATFMPKPIFGINGSGMHTNMSLFQGGKNAFYDPDDPKGLSKEAYSFIAGLLAHVKGMAAVTNPLVNSYKRLVPGYEAPCYLAWSASNRSALIRIPAARGQSTRVELRSPDPACNPYLELAVCLAAGLDGIEKGLTPPPEVTENIFDMNAAARKLTASTLCPTPWRRPSTLWRPIPWCWTPWESMWQPTILRASGRNGRSTAPASPPGNGRSTSSIIKAIPSQQGSERTWKRSLWPLRRKDRPACKGTAGGGRRGRLLGVPHRRPGAAGHKQAASAGGGVRLQAGGSDGGAVL